MQRNRKVQKHTEGEVETFHEGIRIVGLLEKDIKSAGINSIKELKETISK